MRRETKSTLTVLVAILIVVCVVVISIIYFTNNTKKAIAQQDFEAKLAQNWEIVASVANNIQIQAKDPATLVHFARAEYARVQGIHFSDIAPQFRSQAEEFQWEVSAPLVELLRELSGGVKESNFGMILRQAQSTDDGMKRFYAKHPGSIKPASIAALLDTNKSKLVKLPPAVVQPTTTRVIVVDYPTWVQSREQRQAWDTMYSVTRDYFKERTRMQKVVNWSYGSRYNAYFTNSDVQQRLSEGISVRDALLSRLSSIERVEGMSTLSASIKQMLNNSIQSLTILHNTGDYARFKYLNNQNDRIQVAIRRQFGIR